MEISRLEPVPLRTLWPSEAYDFTTWLAENLDLLGETLGMELSLLQQEASAGVFSADILAEDASGDAIVIENQLERTDHDHLGKLITYLSNLDAKAAIWVTSDPRPEHETAIHWLNEMLPADTAFFLIKLEAYRIENSPPAPLLSVVAGPTPPAREAGAKKKELAELQRLRKEFWGQLLELASQRTDLHARNSPVTEAILTSSSGAARVLFHYRVRMHDAEAGLLVDRETYEESKRIFDRLLGRKDAIEEKFGEPLEWLRQDDVRVSYIKHIVETGGLSDRDRWPQIQKELVDAMIRLEEALAPELERLDQF